MADTDATGAKPAQEEERERQSAAEVFAELDHDQGRGGAEPRTPAPPSSAEPRLVGIVSTYPHLLHTTHPFFGPVLAGLRARLLAADCDMLIGSRSPSDDPGPDQFRVERWQRRGIDALVVLSITSHEDVAPLVRSGLPVVFVDFDAFGERTGCVMSDNLDGMAQAVRHLARLGRQRIATISGTLESRPGMDRLLGYRSELSRLGLEERHEYVVAGDFYHRSGWDACRRLLALSEPPDAIAVASDMMAVGAMLAIEEARLRVPEDVAVTGFDDSDFAARLRPALTTVRQDALGLGAAAADAVVFMLENPLDPPPTALLPAQLVVRESCGIELPARGSSSGRGASERRRSGR
ncbi:MAG: LacI family DNA-binding transcriptional regulator [Gaiellaceae bacterium]